MKSFGIALKEKESMCGLTKNEMVDLFDILNDVEAYPIELEAKDHECSAMGFITVAAADYFDFDYERSGLHDFIANILDDMDNEIEDCIYEFKNIKIWLSR